MSSRAPDKLFAPDVAAGGGIQQARITVPHHGLEEPVRPPKVTWGTLFGAAARKEEERAVTLLKWALVFFLVSVVAGVLGFTGISAASADVAQFLFYVFVVIFLVLLILGLTIFRV
jgi:uncharacterized membrane protein YtjA (UPF0391 family)